MGGKHTPKESKVSSQPPFLKTSTSPACCRTPLDELTQNLTVGFPFKRKKNVWRRKRYRFQNNTLTWTSIVCKRELPSPRWASPLCCPSGKELVYLLKASFALIFILLQFCTKGKDSRPGYASEECSFPVAHQTDGWQGLWKYFPMSVPQDTSSVTKAPSVFSLRWAAHISWSILQPNVTKYCFCYKINWGNN